MASKLSDPVFSHTRGKTSVAYSPNGQYLYTVGSNNVLRKWPLASADAEPTVIEITEENTALTVSNTHVIHAAEDGTITVTDARTDTFDKLLIRGPLPARSVALSPDKSLVAVAWDDSKVKVVNFDDNLKVMTLAEQTAPNLHVAWHPSGSLLAVSCSDGAVYVYSLSSEQPELVKKVEGVIMKLNADSAATAKVAWCPDGRAFAAATVGGDIVVVDRAKWERQRAFAGGHTGEVLDFAFSPNGAFLLSSGKEGKVVLWETKTQTVVSKTDVNDVCSIAWHPTENTAALTTSDGKFYTFRNPVPAALEGALKLPTQPAPLINPPTTTRTEVRRTTRPDRSPSPNPLDSYLDNLSDDDDFLIDDDNAGYAEPSRKRPAPADAPTGASDPKRRAFGLWSPEIHEPFQPASTPWRNKRRYLCLNMVGFVWTVDQDTHHTVTIEFHDRETFRDVHFTDPYRYDKACLTEHGAVFSCPADEKSGLVSIYYRPHETWTTRAEWRIFLPPGEEVVSLALSEHYIIACTSTGYVRVYSLYGIPIRVSRQKHLPSVTCACTGDYLITLGNGPVGADGKTSLLYTLENIRRDETLQQNDIVALPPGGSVKNVFFSDAGDPYIYDSDGVLLVLQHWRTPGSARWTPLLDTRLLDRLAEGTKTESYWPVAVAQDRFHCIILKGTETAPYFPRPLLSEFELRVPVPPQTEALEELVLREGVLLSLAEEAASGRVLTAEEAREVGEREVRIDRALLQVMAMCCKEEELGPRAVEVGGLFRGERSREMGVKVAVKFGREGVARRIRELAEEEEGVMEE